MAEFARLNQLIELAKEPSSERRRTLLREVTDIFVENPQGFSESERGHLADIMTHVASEMEARVRSELAYRLAEVVDTPREVLRQLASDEVEVARPILEKSRGLKEEDLIAIIQQKGGAHQELIAARDDVTTAVSGALVEHGNDTVLEKLVTNKGAQIDEETMKRVVKRAEANKDLHEPLVDRDDLSPELMHDMFWFVSSTLRETILSKATNLDPDMVNRLLRESEERILLEMGSAPPEKSRAHLYIEKMIAKRELNEALLVKLCREKQWPELVCGLAHLANIDEKTAKRVFFDKTGEGLAIACKASRFDRSTFSTFILLRETGSQRSIEDTYKLLALYDEVPVDVAQRTMRFWRVRSQEKSEAA
jgi:uncharacterized protein (DUF2336 family)